jgi:hypothetical protein
MVGDIWNQVIMYKYSWNQVKNAIIWLRIAGMFPRSFKN